MEQPNPTFIGLPRQPIFIDPVPATLVPPERPTTPVPNPTFLGLPRQPFAPINPNTQRSTRLTRNNRLQIQTLHDAHHSNADIHRLTGFSKKAIQYALKHRLTPQHNRAGRPPQISSTEGDRLEAFVRASKRNRRLSYEQLLTEVFPNRDDIGPAAVKNCLERRGYRRRIALRKPILSPQNRLTRLNWAWEHLHWTTEQWNSILWSDETWVKSFRHRKTWITRLPGEELEETCIVKKPRKAGGWMFWGCFHADIKGPYLFWEKEWGSINSDSYCQHVIPLVDGWNRIHTDLFGDPELLFMHDNAPGHAAAKTIQELRDRGIRTIEWPAFSPDLNPIKHVWNKMKDWMQREYPDNPLDTTTARGYDMLRQQVTAAWEAIGREYLRELVDTMPERCLDVIIAGGGHTKW